MSMVWAQDYWFWQISKIKCPPNASDWREGNLHCFTRRTETLEKLGPMKNWFKKKACLFSIVLCFWPWHILMYICQYLSISVVFPYLASHPLPNLQMKIALAASLCVSGSATGYHHHLRIISSLWNDNLLQFHCSILVGKWGFPKWIMSIYYGSPRTSHQQGFCSYCSNGSYTPMWPCHKKGWWASQN